MNILNLEEWKIFESVLLEYSKNDPIPELRDKSNLAVFLFGPPASGKSTFVDGFIKKQQDFKVINPDHLSFLQTKDENTYAKGTQAKSAKYTENIIKSGNNFIFDTTGNNFNLITELVKLSKENDYKVVFIHMLTSLYQAKKQNDERKRSVDSEYLEQSYLKSQGLIKQFDELEPHSYYIVVNLYNNIEFFKYQKGKLLKRKNDKYV